MYSNDHEEDIAWTKKPEKNQQSGPKSNPDIQANIALFRKLYLRSEGKLPTGMTVYLSAASEPASQVVQVGWTPPPDIRLDSYARPISVNQSHKSFEKEFKEVFNWMFNFSKRNSSGTKAEVVKFPVSEINDSKGLKMACPYQGDIKVASDMVKQNLSQYDKEWDYFL